MYVYVEPNDNNETVYHFYTRKQVLDEHWEVFCDKIKAILGDDHLITPENCISEWCLIHMAWEV